MAITPPEEQFGRWLRGPRALGAAVPQRPAGVGASMPRRAPAAAAMPQVGGVEAPRVSPADIMREQEPPESPYGQPVAPVADPEAPDELQFFGDEDGSAPVERDDSDVDIASMIDAIASGLSQHRTGRQYDAGYYQGIRKSRDAADEERQQQAKAESQADPDSEVSVKARSALGPTLQSLGLRPEEIAALSKADLDQLAQGGNLQMSLANARQAAQQRIAEQQAQQASMLDKRGYDEGEFDRRADLRHQYKVEENRNLPGGSGSITKAQRASGLASAARQMWQGDPGTLAQIDVLEQSGNLKELNRLASQGRREQSSEKRRSLSEKRLTLREEQEREHRARDYGLALNKSGIPGARKIVERLRSAIASAKEKQGGEIFSGIDEVSRRVGLDPLMGETQKRVVEDAQKLQNVEIKDLSGAAVTALEMPRVNKAMGTGVLSNEADLERFVDRYEAELDAREESYQKAFGTEAWEGYQQARTSFDDEEDDAFGSDVDRDLEGL